MPDLRLAVGTVLDWPVDHVAAAVVTADGTTTAGETERVFRLASVTKLLTAYATLIAVEEGAVDWDTPAGPPGSTVRHLAAHASGLSFAEYLHEAVCVPLGMTATRLTGSPGSEAESSVDDLARFAAELRAPTLTATLDDATRVAFPDLDGILPGFGRQKPNDWGLGFEIRDGKSPHWTGARSSPRTFGHFGQSGTFLWVDPDAGAAAVVLTDRDFGPWAIEAWPVWTDRVLAAARG